MACTDIIHPPHYSGLLSISVVSAQESLAETFEQLRQAMVYAHGAGPCCAWGRPWTKGLVLRKTHGTRNLGIFYYCLAY